MKFPYLKTITIVLLCLIIYWPNNKNITKAKSPSQIGPAFFYIQAPNKATTTVHSIITINTGGQFTNIIQASLSFPADKLQIKNLAINQEICPLLIEKRINNPEGQLNIACAIPAPGWQGDKQLAEIIFNKINNGLANISFTPNSLLLANDGRATNILDTTIGKTIILE